MVITKSKLQEGISAFLKVLLTFGFIFNLSFKAAPSVTTGRIALLVMLVFYGRDALGLAVKFARQFPFACTFFLLLLPISMLWIVVNGADDTVMFSRALWFLLFSIIGAFLYVRMSEFSLSSAMAYFLYATLIQALFVFCTVLVPEFREWVVQVLVESKNIDFTSQVVRFSGLSNGGGALLSLQLGLGSIASLILFVVHRRVVGRLALVLAAILLTAATVFVGRTGLYLSLMALFGFIMFSRSRIVPILSVVLIMAVYLLITTMTQEEVDYSSSEFEVVRTMNWAFDFLLTGKSKSVEGLASQETREISGSELLIGSGRIVESDGESYSHRDVGYIHTIFAIGLPLSFIFYASLLSVYWQQLRVVRGKLKILGWWLVGVVFIAELKEPFIFKYTLPFFVLVYVYLTNYYAIKHVQRNEGDG